MRMRLALAMIVLVAAHGCGGDSASKPTAKPMAKKPAQEKPAAAKAAQAKPAAAKPVAAKPAAGGGGGGVSGRVTLDGAAPAPAKLDVNKDVEVCAKTEKMSESLLVSADGGVANAVVYLKNPPAGAKAAVPSKNPAIDQLGCRYDPHVLMVPAGATVDIQNSDGILHNIHTYSSDNPPFNAAQPKFKKVIRKQLDKPEFVRLTCDVHGWMEAWIVVQGHPFYALTDSNGGFEIDGIPAGEYEVGVWHEKLGEQTGKIVVKAGEKASFTPVMKAS